MKKIISTGNILHKFHHYLATALLLAAVLFCARATIAQPLPGGTNSGPFYTPLASWSFLDNTNWTSDQNYSPVSFTNLAYSYLGNGASLVVDTNLPAWLQYNVVENDGPTNLTVDQGTITFWFAPDWSSTNLGGSGPGECGRLIEVGSLTLDSSLGWWSLYVDAGGNNLFFSAQTNDFSSTVTTYLSAPISWTTNYFHFITLTYSATNTALYVDGTLATNGPGVTVYPGTNALAGGFFIGSDNTGVVQAHGMFNNLYTYNVPLDAATIQETFYYYYLYYVLNPNNSAMANFISATSSPSYTTTYNIFTGQGNLQSVGSVPAISSTNIWLTNVTAQATSGTTTAITFTIQGGADNVPYDVFANSVLSFGNNGVSWAWMGQGNHGNIYSITITNQVSAAPAACFLILGTPQDSDFDGLTDAYELLVSKTNPYNSDTDGDGISDSDEILNGTNPLIPNPVLPTSLNVQACPP